MTRTTWRVSATAILIVSASFGASASAQTLVQTSAAGACSATSSAVAHIGGFLVPSNASAGGTLSCGIDVAIVDIDDIGSAQVFVVDVSSTSNAWARLCARSIVTGASTCGALVYSAGNSTAIQTLSPLMPPDNFDDDYLPYLEVYVPKPSASGYGYFWGYRILSN